MGKLKWLCSSSFIKESVHLRAINQELCGKTNQRPYLFCIWMYCFKMKLCLKSHTEGVVKLAPILKPWNTVLSVSDLGSPSWTSYKNKYLKELCHFKNEKNDPSLRLGSCSISYFLSLIHGETMIVARCRKAFGDTCHDCCFKLFNATEVLLE